jgi:arylsulfatase A-like enzyme
MTQSSPAPRNILFIVLDQWRADALGRAGNGVIKTPNLDSLAQDGVLFANHFAQCAPCGPSRASLLSGMYQHNHGVKRNGTPFNASFTNIALECRKAGYEPALFGYTDTTADPRGLDPKDPGLFTYEGVLPGFEPVLPLTMQPLRWMSYLEEKGYDFGTDARAIYSPANRAPEQGQTRAPAQFAAEHSISSFLTDELLDFISVRRNQSWFAHAAYIRPHPPFIASAPFHDMYEPHDIPQPNRAASAIEEGAVHPLIDTYLQSASTSSFWAGGNQLIKDMSNEDFAQVRATYFGMVTELDQQMGRITDQLKGWGLYDKTLIVVTSDHGEMLGDHWMLGKDSPFEQAYHIPLIVHDPSAEANVTRGKVDTRFTESVDLMPTILQWAGVPVPRQCDGSSLLPALRGADETGWRDAAHWEFDFRDNWQKSASVESILGLQMDRCGMTALRSTTHLYIHFTALPPLLFDLKSDPHCLRNLAGDPASAVAMLACAQRLLSWQMESAPRLLTGMTAGPAGLLVRN